ncbi:suppressor of tumorigenicity 14 protein-like [Liolophura sinensis]|uniref:suppressor of tumorigenicity 14 protein-like n=1 Tax=Liolophura sinensis TaxID=3198878 RepID=UPI0031584DE9
MNQIDVTSNLCQKKLYIELGETKNFSHSAFAAAFSEHDLTFCKYEIETKPGNLIRVQIKNRIQLMAGAYHDDDCLDNYIHVGNDPRRVGVEMLTSYKLCRTTTEQEIVSRGNYVWLIVRSLEPSIFSWLLIHYQSQVKVLCNATAFQCSPVQCVPKTAICNGIQDCDNGRDEYCDLGFQQRQTSSETEPCFMCEDGSCINPVLPRYSLDWGKHLWYLCDEFSHCPDGTDERKDVCYRIKGRASALFRCTPKDRNMTAHLWDTVLCDGQQDCEGGEDESHDLCTPAMVKPSTH